MQGKQKIQKSLPKEGWTESNRQEEAQSICESDNVGRVTYDNLIEKVLDDNNIKTALKQVVGNKGSPGIDGMSVFELQEKFPTLVDSLKERIRTGRYKPQPVRRVEIPKDNGGVRKLGIPTVIDRLVQQMIAQVLVPIYDPMFSESSFGFRPGRSAQDAILRMKELYEEGYTVAVSIDLEKYFDTIPQDNLMTLIRKTVRDRTLTDLIKRFLKSGVVLQDGLHIPTVEGAPQGGPLSPLLSNIYLDQFDKELERRGHRHIRYADDAVIYVRTPRAGQRVMESCTEFLEKKLKLKVNREKSIVGSPTEMKYLGFRLYVREGEVGILPHQKSLKKFHGRIKKITRRHRGVKLETIISELRVYMRGWMAYFGFGTLKAVFETLDSWVRRRVRVYAFIQWKTPRNRRKQLKKIGHRMKDEILYWLSYQNHPWNPKVNVALNNILHNGDIQKAWNMYFLADDWEKVQERWLKSPLPGGTMGSVRGRQSFP